MSSEEVLASIRVVMADQYTEPNHGKKSCEFLQSKNASTSCFEQLSTFVVDKSPDICTDDDPNDSNDSHLQKYNRKNLYFCSSSVDVPGLYRIRVQFRAELRSSALQGQFFGHRERRDDVQGDVRGPVRKSKAFVRL